MKTGFRTAQVLSVIIGILTGITSLGGLSAPGIYSMETPNWQVQTLAQDFINIIIVLPLLAASVIMMRKQRQAGLYLAAGTIAFLCYTYAIYCFSIHFNIFFVVYCAIFGISLFSLFYIYTIGGRTDSAPEHRGLEKITGIYFVLVAAFFFLLWMGEIIPSILHRTVPASLTEVGLPTNPIHVLDLSVCLPLIFIAGIAVLRKTGARAFLIPVVLTFFTVMDVSIATLSLVMVHNGFEESYTVAGIMYGLSAFSLVLLIIHLKTGHKQQLVYV